MRSFRKNLNTPIALVLASMTVGLLQTPLLASEAIDSIVQRPQWTDDAQSLTLSLDFPEPELRQQDGEAIYHFADESLIGKPGAPKLPLVNRLLKMPNTSDARLSIVSEHWQSLGSRLIAPEQERLHTDLDLPLSWIQDQEIYSTDAFWPSQTVQMGNPMLLRDNRLLKLSIQPMRWNPITLELQYLDDLEVRVDFEGYNPHNALHNSRPASPLFAGFIKDQVILPPAEESRLNEIIWNAPSAPMRYLVIGKTSAMTNVRFQDWLDWKHRKGHPIDLITDSDVSWSASAIRTAIVTAYNSESPPEFVMLLGDSDGGTYQLPTSSSQYDHYYANLTDDILGDLVVGRISARSSTNLSTIFNKILAYEQAPDLSNPNWLHRASFLTGTNHCGESMSQLSRSIAIDLVNDFSYTTIDTAFCANSPTYVYNWYNQGISFHNYRGWIGMEGLSTSTILGLTHGNRTPISVIFTCSSGDFNESWSEPAYTEAFLRAGTPVTPGGGAAAMGFCTPNTHTAYNNLVCGGFWSAILHYGIREVGTAMFRGKYELFRNLPTGDNNINNFSYWANLMGDPGMPVWLGEPGVLALDELASSVSENSSELGFRVIDGAGSPVAEATICLSQADGFQLIAHTGDDGRISMVLPQMNSSLPLLVTASKDDYVPALADLGVSGTLPAVAELEFSGSQPDYLLPGSNYAFRTQIENLGDTALSDLQLDLSLNDGVGSITIGTQSVPDLAIGASAWTTGDFEFSVAPGYSDHSDLSLNLTLNSGTDAVVYHRIPMDVGAPQISVVNANVGNQTLLPGATEVYTVTIANGGLLDGNDLVFSGDFNAESLLEVTSATQQQSVPADGSTATLSFTVHADATSIPGNRDNIHVHWVDPSGPEGDFVVPIQMGLRQSNEPTGPDAYGYYAYENTDNWPLAMDYGWIEIAPSAGGSGDLVILDDHGDEQDDARMVDLPFPFTYYGRTYTQMSVCSNGFVAFGPNAHLEADFRNHFMPVGMGPEAMIAVMWDDHKLTNDAQVCTSYLEESDMFVIEWYRVRTNSNNSINTFQLLLLDPAVYETPSGDGEFVAQYHTFNNNQSNSQDFPYCTIGIEDHSALVGLTLTNYNSWDPTATVISSTRSIRYTTLGNAVSGDSHLTVDTSPLNFTLSNTDESSDLGSIQIGNSGEGLMSWSARAESLDDWLPEGIGVRLPNSSGSRDNGGPDTFGYTWIDSNDSDGPEVHWTDITETGTAISFVTNDSPVGPFELPFSFPFYGQTFDSYYIAPNGYISFTDTANYWNNSNGAMPSNLAPQNSICGWWDDLLTDDDSEGYVYIMATDDTLIVSYVAARHFNPAQFGGPFSFQLILESNGRITIQYADMAEADDDSDSGTSGLQGPDNTKGFVIHHMEQAIDNYAVQILPPIWLHLPVTGGLLGAEGSTDVSVEVYNAINGLLPEGDYSGRVTFNANTGQEAIIVDVGLHIGTVSVDSDPEQPASFALENVYPNPFNPATRIDFSTASRRPVTLAVYNLQGQLVSQLLQYQLLEAGDHSLVFDGTNLASGVYLLRMTAGDFQQIRKMTLLK